MESIPEDAGALAGQGSHVTGTAVPIDAEPNTGYLFAYWIKDGGIYAYQPDTVIVIDKDLHLEGFFKRPTYEISAATDPPEGGFVTGPGDYKHFEEVELQAIPNTGYQFLHWKEDGVVVLDGDEPAGESYIFIAEEHRHLVAHFELKLHEVMAYPVPEEGGAIAGAGTYDHFEYITLEASQATGYTFSHWEEDGDTFEEDNTNLSVMVTRNRSFEAHFAINTYDITAQPNDADFGSVTGAGTYEHFEEVTLSAIPETGYYFVEWTEDGEVVIDGDEPAGEVYSFIAEEARNLVAHFALQTFMVTFVVEDEDGQAITDATVTLNGLENSPGEYLFEDLAAGDYSYLVEADGYFSEDGMLEVIDSDITMDVILTTDDTSIDDSIPFELLVYPNPVTDKLFIESNIPLQRVTLIDLLGQIVLDVMDQEESTFYLPVSGYPAGYIS